MKSRKTFIELNLALEENARQLHGEMNLSRRVELLYARLEIMKSLIHRYQELINNTKEVA